MVQKSCQPVKVGSWKPTIYRGFSTIQTVVGLGISELSTVVFGDSMESFSGSKCRFPLKAKNLRNVFHTFVKAFISQYINGLEVESNVFFFEP